MIQLTKNNLFLGSFVVLLIWLIVSIVQLTNYDKRLRNESYENNRLEEEISHLRGKVNDLEEKNDDLSSEISDLNSQIEEGQNNYSGYNTYSQNNVSSSIYNSIVEGYKQRGTATVVERKIGCNYILLENSNGFILAQWTGGHCPEQGDIMAGEVDSYGAHDLYGLSTQLMSDVWIESFRMSREDALQRFGIFCP